MGGGVWRSDNAGRTWEPVFDGQPIASIGSIAVAPSDPRILYAGSGEADMRSDISYGNGVYKSADAGKTWRRVGLEDTRQIGRILVDPEDPNRVFVAALGHAYGPNGERGVFRSRDGGEHWTRVLFRDENTGAIDLAFDPRDSRTILAALWQTRRPPWNVYAPSNGPGSGLYRSQDGGDTWSPVTGHGFPSAKVGRIRLAFAPSRPSRVYALVDAEEGGLYVSDDAATSWVRASADRRIWERGWYFAGVTVDPKDAEIVYACDTALYRSTDGGRTFVPFKGAPGGDDYHQLWIDPGDSRRMILASDQGAVVTVDGGKTWSSWYNQPTAQFYHVATDDRFPYWIYGAQQDSGAAATPVRTDHGNLTSRDWRPIAAGGENGYIAPDPRNPEILFGGSVGRFDSKTLQEQDIDPTLAYPDEYRGEWTLPLAFSPRDPSLLYYANQFLFRTSDAGRHWERISPDLTREAPGVPGNLDPVTAQDSATRGPRRGVIYAIAPSSLRDGMVWCGTDDGLVWLTRDAGEHWEDVTPRSLAAWSKVGVIEPSHFEPDTAFAAIDRHRLDDLGAYVERTRDGGKTWTSIAAGIPVGSYVNVVREDPERRGLLYAGTETGVFVSFDEGDHWQPLQGNLPTCSVRDIAVRQGDLVVATHGRSFWVLDDLSPLRQLDARVASARAWLFAPRPAVRLRAAPFLGTPDPKDEPLAENPPEGAILDYFLRAASGSPVTVEIRDARGEVVRRFAGDEPVKSPDLQKIRTTPDWVAVEERPSASAGMHRFVWDLRYAAPKALTRARRSERESGIWAASRVLHGCADRGWPDAHAAPRHRPGSARRGGRCRSRAAVRAGPASRGGASAVGRGDESGGEDPGADRHAARRGEGSGPHRARRLREPTRGGGGPRAGIRRVLRRERGGTDQPAAPVVRSRTVSTDRRKRGRRADAGRADGIRAPARRRGEGNGAMGEFSPHRGARPHRGSPTIRPRARPAMIRSGGQSSTRPDDRECPNGPGRRSPASRRWPASSTGTPCRCAPCRRKSGACWRPCSSPLASGLSRRRSPG